MGDDSAKTSKGWLWRLGGVAVLLGNIGGLPLRLYWEDYFRGVGLLCFLLGIIVGAVVSSRLRRRIGLRGMIAFFGVMTILVIVAYALYINSVDQVEGPQYSLSARMFLESFLYGTINCTWGLCAEVAARTTASLGRPDRS